jgi:hypothetical protein
VANPGLLPVSNIVSLEKVHSHPAATSGVAQDVGPVLNTRVAPICEVQPPVRGRSRKSAQTAIALAKNEGVLTVATAIEQSITPRLV